VVEAQLGRGRVAALAGREVVVRLVEHDRDVLGHPGHERAQLVTRQVGAGGVAGVVDQHDPGGVVDDAEQRVDVAGVPVRLGRRRAHPSSPRRTGRRRSGRRAGRRRTRARTSRSSVVTVAALVGDEVHQERGRPGAHRDLVDRAALELGEALPQLDGLVVGVQVRLGDRLVRGRHRPRRRPERRLVRRQPHRHPRRRPHRRPTPPTTPPDITNLHRRPTRSTRRLGATPPPRCEAPRTTRASAGCRRRSDRTAAPGNPRRRWKSGPTGPERRPTRREPQADRRARTGPVTARAAAEARGRAPSRRRGGWSPPRGCPAPAR
jgi:hypothetical protein